MILVERRALRLNVGPVRTAHVGPFIHLNARPFQRTHNAGGGGRHEARAVRVLDPEYHGAARTTAREQVVEQRRSQAAQVQRARGRRRKAHAHRRCGHARHRTADVHVGMHDVADDATMGSACHSNFGFTGCEQTLESGLGASGAAGQSRGRAPPRPYAESRSARKRGTGPCGGLQHGRPCF